MSRLAQDNVTRTLIHMAVPMLAGTFAMNAYNLTDAWFVSKLGLLPQTAIGFTFPVVMLFSCLSMGLGAGVTSYVARVLGGGHHRKAAHSTTHGLALIVGVGAVASLAGYLGMESIFLRLGADAVTMPLIRDFMTVWYAGSPFLYVGSMGNGVLISAGDSKAAGRFMMFGTLLNMALNPLFIFGGGGLPALGIRGSALATITAQAVSAVWMFAYLGRRHGLLWFKPGAFAGWAASSRAMLALGVPSVLSMLLMPLSASIITRLLSRFGREAVAAGGVAARIEMFAFIIPMALGMSLMPFVGNNFGANRPDRVREALRVSTRFALAYGALVTALFFVFAPSMASWFSQDEAVLSVLVRYIRIISFGYGMMEVHRYCGFVLTGLHRPLSTLFLNAVRVLGLLIPLSLLGAQWGGITGLFTGRLVSDLLAGSLGLFWAHRVCRSLGSRENGAKAQPVPLTTPDFIP